MRTTAANDATFTTRWNANTQNRVDRNPMKAPSLPAVPRCLNFVGRQLARVGLRGASLAPDGVLEAARRKSGLDDFGDDDFREGLSRLTQSLEDDAHLTPLGRFIVRGELVAAMVRRMQIHDWHTRHPEIAQRPVTRPIIMMGQGRTGTTILHELLALDPANRVPLTWEVDNPSPPPESAHYLDDPRIDATQATLDRADSLIPDFKRIHRMGARLPQECVRITANEFASMIFAASWRVPSYVEWLLHEADLAPVYAAHRRTLQLLQWRCPGERWVLKSPGHLWHLEDMTRQYPDALLIQTHRDPVKVLSSLSSLEVVLRKMTSDDVDHADIAREWSRWNASGFERSVAFRESGGVPASQIVDVQFREFIRDPLAEVERIYRHFDLELTPDVAARIRAYVEANPSDRDGRHTHDFSETGLDLEAEREKVKRYQDYFGVESEI